MTRELRTNGDTPDFVVVTGHSRPCFVTEKRKKQKKFDDQQSFPQILVPDVSQMGSLAGAAHLLKDNTSVQRQAQWEQKSHVEQKGKSLSDI